MTSHCHGAVGWHWGGFPLLPQVFGLESANTTHRNSASLPEETNRSLIIMEWSWFLSTGHYLNCFALVWSHASRLKWVICLRSHTKKTLAKTGRFYGHWAIPILIFTIECGSSSLLVNKSSHWLTSRNGSQWLLGQPVMEYHNQLPTWWSTKD